VRRLIFAVLFLTLAACKGPPARLVAGRGDTVVVNNRGPVRLPIRVLDAAARPLQSNGVRYQWLAGTLISVSTNGVVNCTEPGDATVRASLGSLVTHLIVLCRPVREVRTIRMMNLVVGEPAQEFPFEAIDAAGRPVTLLMGQVTVSDSMIATVEGVRIRARAQGSTDLTMRVGDQLGFASVHVYEPVRTLEGIRRGQHVAIPVRLSTGEMRRWRIPASPENYFLAILPADDAHPAPGLAIVGANCVKWLAPHSYFCLAQRDASVTVYHPQQVDASKTLTGTLVVWSQ
jgi:hypothetical protein